MKKQLLLFCMVFSAMLVSAQTASLLILNSNSSTSAGSLDIVVEEDGNVVASYQNVDFLDASTKISVPSSAILNVNFLVAGTSTVFYSLKDQVYSSNEFTIIHLFGTSSSKRAASFSGYDNSSSSSKVKLDFRYSSDFTEDIDLKVRENGNLIADNFSYGETTFTFNDEYNATDMVLDIKEHASGRGLYAYDFPASTLGGDYVYLFTSGADMYMLEMNGVTTKLSSKAPISSSSVAERNQKGWEVFPNPTSNFISVQSDVSNLTYTFNIVSSFGQIVKTAYGSNQVDVSDLSEGAYYINVSNKSGNLATFKFLKIK
jgi:hypothetical protein